MSPSGDKIVTRLRDRRQIDTALDRLRGVTSELELRRQVQAIVEHGREVIPSLVGRLRGADPRSVALLGMVASHLDQGDTAEALFWVLQQPGRTFSERSGAVTILERFLGVQVSDDLRPGLAEATQAAVSTLPELLDRAAVDALALAGAVEEFDQQPPDVVLAVVAALKAMAGARPVELLRMLAQDVRDEISAAAIEALGGRRLPEAAHSLQTLAPAAGSVQRPRVERLLRKQRLAGVEVAPLLPLSTAYRALVGPVDGEGQRQVWLIEETAGSLARRLLVLVLSDEAGAVQAAEHQNVHKASLPRRQPSGTWSITRVGRHELPLAETTWDTGRRLVADALDRNRETQIPLPGVLRLLGSWLWGVRAGGFDALPRLDPEEAGEELAAQSESLVAHPAFAAWRPALEASVEAADEALRRPAWGREAWVLRQAAHLVAEPSAARRLAERLRANGEWLALAGEGRLARVALAAAEAVEMGQAQHLPLWLALVRRDLDAALAWMEPSGRPRGPRRNEGER